MEFTAGRWRARLVPLAEAGAALDLRARAFRGGAADGDAFDAEARHLLIEDEDEDGGGIAGCARLTVQADEAILRGYTAAFYDLAGFARAFPVVLEVGRVALSPGMSDPEVPRLLLAILACVVEAEGIAALYGCASFPPDGAGMARLAGAVAPDAWRPAPKAAEVMALTGLPGALPPLLRAYLTLGAGVSDHAVVDRDLGTTHVFAALPIAAIPPARARLLTGMLAPA